MSQLFAHDEKAVDKERHDLAADDQTRLDVGQEEYVVADGLHDAHGVDTRVAVQRREAVAQCCLRLAKEFGNNLGLALGRLLASSSSSSFVAILAVLHAVY